MKHILPFVFYDVLLYVLPHDAISQLGRQIRELAQITHQTPLLFRGRLGGLLHTLANTLWGMIPRRGLGRRRRGQLFHRLRAPAPQP